MLLKSQSHRDWSEAVILAHDKEKPYSPENGNNLKFSVGDKVVYTNSYGLTFETIITGLYRPEKITTSYALGDRYYIKVDCHWMTYKEASLEKLED